MKPRTLISAVTATIGATLKAVWLALEAHRQAERGYKVIDRALRKVNRAGERNT